MNLVTILQISLLFVSILISSLVLWGQRRSSIRESIEQLDDRDLSSHNYKVKPILHDVKLDPPSTEIGFRLGSTGGKAGISNPYDIKNVSDNIDEVVQGVPGVEDSKLKEYSAETNIEDREIDESHTELRIICNTVDPVECRNISDKVMAEIRMADRVN